MNISEANLKEAGMLRVKQLGMDYVLLADSPPIPSSEADIRSRMEKGSFPNVISGKPGATRRPLARRPLRAVRHLA
jgi:hypothetical protein